MPLQIFVLRVAACFAKIQNIMVPASITIEGWTHLFASVFRLSSPHRYLKNKRLRWGRGREILKKKKGERKKRKEIN